MTASSDSSVRVYPPLPTLELLQQREGNGWHSTTYQTGSGIVTVRVNEVGDVTVTRNGRENRWPVARPI